MRVVLVDDHELFREGFKLLLARVWGRDLQVVEVSSAEEGLRLPENLPADLVFLDLGLPGLGGLEGLEAFRKRFPTIPIVVVSAVVGREMVRNALACGAQGYLPKTASRQDMLDARAEAS